MDVEKVLPPYYRYNLDSSLNERPRAAQAKQDYLFIDAIMGVKPPYSAVKAPQDIGETRHSLLDEKPSEETAEAAGNDSEVQSIEETFQASTADKALRYRAYSRLNLLESRRAMEDAVRTNKRLRRECPYRSDNRLCTKVFIRCGQRSQFSLRETMAQRVRPHGCNYVPSNRGGHILIVESDPHIREFCKQTVALFFGLDDAAVATTDSVKHAIELLNRSKMENTEYGLIIIDVSLPKDDGFGLVNELYRRNYNSGIILTKNGASPMRPPKDYIGDKAVAPNERFVGIVLPKPFHSETLVQALKKLNFKES